MKTENDSKLDGMRVGSQIYHVQISEISQGCRVNQYLETQKKRYIHLILIITRTSGQKGKNA